MDEAVPHHREAATVLHQLLDDVPMAGAHQRLRLDARARRRLRPARRVRRPPPRPLRRLDQRRRDARRPRRDRHLPDPARPRRPRPRRSRRPAGLARHGADGPEVGPPPAAPRRHRRRSARASTSTSATATSPPTPPRTSSTSTRSRRPSIPTTLVVLSCEAQARTLPWPECPNALASAGRIAGEPVAGLRAKVHADFRGTTTCTHLNDVLRCLAGVTRAGRRRCDEPTTSTARSRWSPARRAGVGAAIAVALAEAGADVACAARSTVGRAAADARARSTRRSPASRRRAATRSAVPTNLADAARGRGDGGHDRRALRAARHPREQRGGHLRRRPRHPAASGTSW